MHEDSHPKLLALAMEGPFALKEVGEFVGFSQESFMLVSTGSRRPSMSKYTKADNCGLVQLEIPNPKGQIMET